jgi:DNA (cytosine-5)-methyltransferase 1
LTPWDVQSRRIFEETGTWPSLYSGEGGGHGYIKTEEKKGLGFDGYNGDLTGELASTLGVNCGMSTGRNGVITPTAFAANQRDEVRDLHDVAGAIQAQPGMKQQTFVADTEKINAFHVNQRDEVIDPDGISGALLATRNMQMQTFITEPLICLNDHGGERMDITEEVTPTLRAGMGRASPSRGTAQLPEWMGHPAKPCVYTRGNCANPCGCRWRRGQKSGRACACRRFQR